MDVRSFIAAVLIFSFLLSIILTLVFVSFFNDIGFLENIIYSAAGGVIASLSGASVAYFLSNLKDKKENDSVVINVTNENYNNLLHMLNDMSSIKRIYSKANSDPFSFMRMPCSFNPFEPDKRISFDFVIYINKLGCSITSDKIYMLNELYLSVYRAIVTHNLFKSDIESRFYHKNQHKFFGFFSAHSFVSSYELVRLYEVQKEVYKQIDEFIMLALDVIESVNLFSASERNDVFRSEFISEDILEYIKKPLKGSVLKNTTQLILLSKRLREHAFNFNGIYSFGELEHNLVLSKNYQRRFSAEMCHAQIINKINFTASEYG